MSLKYLHDWDHVLGSFAEIIVFFNTRVRLVQTVYLQSMAFYGNKSLLKLTSIFH